MREGHRNREEERIFTDILDTLEKNSHCLCKVLKEKLPFLRGEGPPEPRFGFEILSFSEVSQLANLCGFLGFNDTNFSNIDTILG